MYIMAWLESWILEAGLSDELEVLQSCIRGWSRGLFLPNSLAFPKNKKDAQISNVIMKMWGRGWRGRKGEGEGGGGGSGGGEVGGGGEVVKTCFRFYR
jgi:hypothetical protein